MNPASRIWDIPPPPGTEDFDLHSSEPAKDRQPAEERPIDRINPYLKRSDYVEYEKRRKRSRSRSRHRRRYSRSRSRRSRSRSRRRRRRYSSSRSRSRSPRRRHKRAKRRKRSRSRSRSRTKGARKSRKSRTPSPPRDSPERSARFEDEDDEASKDNVFKNDGTFLEMFKKMQEQREGKVEERSAGVEQKKALPAFGKRRGGKVLKTGLVQKVRLPNEEENNSQDVWSVYMKEVRKYKEACCDDDSKTRPLVK